MQYGYFDNKKENTSSKTWLCPVPGQTIWVSRTWQRSSITRREVICSTRRPSITGSAVSVGMGYPWIGRDSMYTSEIMRRRITIPSPGSRWRRTCLRQTTAAVTDCLTRSMKVSMTDWHLHRRWSFPVGRMYCCGT